MLTSFQIKIKIHMLTLQVEGISGMLSNHGHFCAARPGFQSYSSFFFNDQSWS